MPDTPALRPFVLVKVDDRVVLAEAVSEEFIKAEDWKAARGMVPATAFQNRPGHGFSAQEDSQ